MHGSRHWEPLSGYKSRLISANAYLGIAPLMEALDLAPDVVVAGRTTDIALFLVSMAHTFGLGSGRLGHTGGGNPHSH